MDTREVVRKIDAVIKALQDLKETLENDGEVNKSVSDEQRLQDEAIKLLDEQGVSRYKHGFAELRDAICIVAKDPEKGIRVSGPNGLYGIVATKHKKHYGSMHYSMRSAIWSASNLTLPCNVPLFINQAAEIVRERSTD